MTELETYYRRPKQHDPETLRSLYPNPHRECYQTRAARQALEEA